MEERGSLRLHSTYQTCHYSGLTGIYPGNGKKVPVSGQLGQNSGELPITQTFFFFFFLRFFRIVFYCKVSICGIKHIDINSYSINILSRSRVEWDVFSS